MKSYVTIIAIFLCIAVSNARHFEQRDVSEAEEAPERKPHPITNRHKRRSWHTSYGYEYPVPLNPYYSDRRDYEQHSQQDYLPQIWRLLDEIASYVRRPPPPPQPIYVPYPVAYPAQQTCKCITKEPPKDTPDIGNRFKGMEDEQNWGLVNSDEGDEEEGDGTRPISFVPLIPRRPLKRPSMQVEHGSKQAGIASLTTQAPASAAGQARIPGMCDVFSLSCCSGTPQQQKQCFTNVGCSMTYDNGRACDKDRILAIIDAYSKTYAPVVQ